MARTKLKVKSKGTPPASREPVSGDDVSLHGYVVINMVFAGFCLVQWFLVLMILKDHAGVNFFFGFLVVAFLVVSIFDYLARRLSLGEVIDEP